MTPAATPADEALHARIERLARRAAEGAGLELGWVELKGGGTSSVVRVFLDRLDGEVSIVDCERVTERLGILLDADDPIEGSYTLEVSSPGLDRPLFDEKDYVRFAGRRASLKTAQPVQGRRRISGRLRGVNDGAVVLEMDHEGRRPRDARGTTLSIPLSVVESGRLEVELTKPNREPHQNRVRKRA
jgi:ribosome maturation factor RimP